jgi:DNA mismatch endonuclease (patch repair protein)
VGHPDIYLPKYKLAVFVHGCFWHRHEGCKYSYFPKSRPEFWKNKFENNIHRDQIVREELKKQGYRYLIVWECAINLSRKKSWSSDSLIDAVIDFINSERGYGEISTDIILPS